jgi:hypothetical protein
VLSEIGSVSKDGEAEGTKEPYLIPSVPGVELPPAAFPYPVMVFGIAMRFEALRSFEAAVAVEAGERHVL